MSAGERYAIIVGAVLLAAGLTTLFIASKLQRVISAPILQLATVADRVASGRDYTLRAVKRGNDEVGRLIDGLNEMLTQIQARDLELAAARDNLERRVEQRTAELQQEVIDRKQAEVALAYERDLLRSLMDNAPDLVYFKDLKSSFIQGSKALGDYLGVRPEDLVGKNDFAFFSEQNARDALADEEKIIRSGQPLIGQIEKRTSQNGTTWWMLTTKMPLRDRAGQIVGTFGISKDITELKRTEGRLEEMHKQLLETSRKAGMAEVATGVLHNVGNVLNSINVSASLVSEQIGQSQVARLTRLVALLHEHETDLSSFLTVDPKGKQVLGYLDKLAEQFATEQKTIENELESLRKNVMHVKDIVAMQQSYGRVSGVAETRPAGRADRRRRAHERRRLGSPRHRRRPRIRGQSDHDPRKTQGAADHGQFDPQCETRLRRFRPAGQTNAAAHHRRRGHGQNRRDRQWRRDLARKPDTDFRPWFHHAQERPRLRFA